MESHLAEMRGEADPRTAEGMASPIFGKLCSDAVEGDANAQFQLAELFRKGWFAPRDRAEAFIWYEAAAAGGHPEARAMMGLWILQGFGTPMDVQRGLRILEEAVDSGNAMGTNIYGTFLRLGLSPEQAAAAPDFREDVERGKALIRAAAEAGDPNAALQMASLTSSRGRTPESEDWLIKAAAGGNAAAQYGVAAGILEGRFGEVDEQIYFRMLVQAAVNGDQSARNQMARYYQMGTRGFPLDYKMAEFWYRKAAEAGSMEAERQLAARAQWGVEEKREMTAGEVWVAGFVALFALGVVMDAVYGSEPVYNSYEAPNLRSGLHAACYWMTPTERIWAECQ